MSFVAKLKRYFLWIIMLVLFSTGIVGLQPGISTSALSNESKKRTIASALAYCLYHQYAITENDSKLFGDITDYWEGQGNAEVVPVGITLGGSDGVMTCIEVLTSLGDVATDLGLAGSTYEELRDSLETKIISSTSYSGSKISDFGAGLDQQVFEDAAKQYAHTVIASYVFDIPVSDKSFAERLLPAVDLCFQYKTTVYQNHAPHYIDDVKLANGDPIYLEWKDQNWKVIAAEFELSTNDGVWSASDIEISGIISTGYDDSQLDMNGEGENRENRWEWNFYPFGVDGLLVNPGNQPSYGGGHGVFDLYRTAALFSCSEIYEARDRIFKEYEINADGKLTIDGKTAQELLDEAPADSISGTGDTAPGCESVDALGWIACPIIKGLYGFSEWVFNSAIVPLLKTDPINTSKGITYTIWSSLRTLGNIVLIFALLFVVLGQAIGGGMIDAYTAKKAMPRIFVAAILINLSINIVAIMIDITNILGNGIRSLLVAPVLDAGYDIRADGGVAMVGAIFIGGLVFLLYRAWTSPKGSTSRSILLYAAVFFGIPILITIIGIFATLIVRMGSILLLTALSPVAMALFVLPSTEKFFKKWFDLFIKTLLVYPIVVSLFAIATLLSLSISQSVGGLDYGDILSALAVSGVAGFFNPVAAIALGGTTLALSGGGNLSELFPAVISILVLFAPMAMIPFAFKLAGGLMGSLVGIATKARSKVSHSMEQAKHRPPVFNPMANEGKGGYEYGGLSGIHHRAGHGLTKAFSKDATDKTSLTPSGRTARQGFNSLFRGKKYKEQLRQQEALRNTGRLEDPSSAGSRGAVVQDARRRTQTQPESGATDPTGAVLQIIRQEPPPRNEQVAPATQQGPAGGPTGAVPPYRGAPAPSSPVDYGFGSFGAQQASGQNNSNDGYTTPGGIIVPDTDTVRKINEEKNK